jgi:NADPH2 dehydrogenase
MAANSIVFEPLKVGDLTLSNRIALAPLTRIRASKEHVPQGT